MAETSKIEEITLAVIAELETLKHEGLFRLVTRDQPWVTGPEWLSSVEKPALLIDVGLPQPVTSSGHQGLGKDVFLSQFQMLLVVVDSVNTGMGARINNLADEVWRIVLADQTKSGLAASAAFRFDERPKIVPPNVWFGGSLTIVYKHTKGGI